MTKEELRGRYIEATARKLVLREEAAQIQVELMEQIDAFYAEHDTPPLTPSELSTASEEAIELSGLGDNAHEVQALRFGIQAATAMFEERSAAVGRPSARQIGRVL